MKSIEKNVEVIWGGGPDEKLKDGVRITILATGFGVKDVADKKDILGEDIAELIDEEEQNRRNRLIKQYYGEGIQDLGRTRRHETFLFDPSTLDNDDIISRIESSPTFERTRQQLKKIKALAASDNAQTEKDKEPGENKNDAVADGVINFG